MNKIIRLMAVVVVGTWTASALAAVTAEEAKQLGTTLTLFGAEKAGNKDGTIPAYTGEPIKVPACYNPKEPGTYCDPWNEKPLFSITAQNMAQYADKLTEGQKELFKKYPNYRMDIYPTHRSIIYPRYVLDNTVKNATACNGKENETLLEGCYGGLPFPIPKTGNQVMWNHIVRFLSFNTEGNGRSIFVDGGGKVHNQGDQWVTNNAPFYDPANSKPLPTSTPYYRVRLDTYGPPRLNGQKLVFIMNLDPIHAGNRVFQYLPGQRRVKLVPDLSYDTPSPVSGGAATMDEQNLFFGAVDRFDFKIVGKKEAFIIYNNFVVSDYKRCPLDVLVAKNFPNPECVRWELHRTWHVHATAKPGVRNILPKRDLYFDEDEPGAGIAESYDAAGKLYRVGNQVSYPYYNAIGGVVGNSFYNLDLQTGAWALNSFLAIKGYGYYPVSETKPESFWSPDSMAGEGIR